MRAKAAKRTWLTHTETTLDAGGTVMLASGRDTLLKGAQVGGEYIEVNADRNLTLQSEQDSDHYSARQRDISAGGSFSFGSMSGTANISASQDKLRSDFDSVKEQTGLFAGRGGYDINVGHHTQLDGAVIASTAGPDQNLLIPARWVGATSTTGRTSRRGTAAVRWEPAGRWARTC